MRLRPVIEIKIVIFCGFYFPDLQKYVVVVSLNVELKGFFLGRSNESAMINRSCHDGDDCDYKLLAIFVAESALSLH